MHRRSRSTRARPDFYYFWGECLRDEGKPREAAEKFRSALLRNQYETAEDLYQLKLWLSEIQADQEVTSGTDGKIDAALATTPRPPYSALFADAARKIKANHFDEAAKLFAQAQQLTEPVVFRVITQESGVRAGKLASRTGEVLSLGYRYLKKHGPGRSSHGKGSIRRQIRVRRPRAGPARCG